LSERFPLSDGEGDKGSSRFSLVILTLACYLKVRYDRSHILRNSSLKTTFPIGAMQYGKLI